MGDEVEEEVTYSVKSENEVYWHGILNGKVIFKEFGNEVSIKMELKRNEYFRVEGYNSNKEIQYFLNPIHNKVEIKKDVSWFDIKSYINKGE